MELPWGMLFMLTGALVSEAVLENYYPKQNITCSQGLARCRAKEAFPLGLHDFGPVEILGLDVKPMLCCKENRKCKTCVHTRILLRILPKDDEGEKRSGEHEDSGDAAAVTVCFLSGPNLPHCWKVNFVVTPNARENHSKAELTVVQYDGIFLGTTVNVTVKSMVRSVRFPHLSEACAFTDIEECKTPRIYPEIDRHKGVVELKEASEDLNQPKSLLMCMKRGRQGMCLNLPSSKWTIPLHAVTPCLCFQAWREETPYSRSEFCPFSNNTEFQKNIMKNVSLSVAHAVSNKGHPVLSWNLTAPCRLEAELWPCQMEAESDSGCKEVQGFRVTLGTYSQWQENVTTLWTSGTFEDLVDIHSTNLFLHCMMVKLEEETLGPLCQHDIRRGRWSILVLVTLLVFSLTVFGMYVLREKLKGWHSNWDKRHHSKEGLGEVLLLHTSEADQGSLVCGLGTVLSEIGFRVYLDLWSQAEVCSVGPAPWLHSHISHLHKHSGKALILLSGSALDRAKGFWDIWNEEKNGKGQLPDMKENGIVGDKPLPGISLDVFGSALGCILSDHLKDGAADHFALVQFDSHKFINREMDVPELFQGLRLYQLPSETCRLLTELHADRPESISAQLKMVLWLRRASRRLAKGLRDSGKELRTRADSMFTQLDVLSMEGEETVI
ncbi:uncharacterized protein il17rc [Electrophorus electricus]|uniref:uncharacterized protein il17rc n=1 Tax=Electrophorus electricus TaxID=8005 RepID=UPI0015D0351F|nr:uncharacterized protein il17rc [Electrophorus electricus]